MPPIGFPCVLHSDESVNHSLAAPGLPNFSSCFPGRVAAETRSASDCRALQQVRKTADEPLFNSLMEQHHYLGYEQPVGEHLKYLVWAQGGPIACMAWSSAPHPTRPRTPTTCGLDNC